MSKDLTEKILDGAMKEIEKIGWHPWVYVFHPKDLEMLRKYGLFKEENEKSKRTA